MKPLLIGQAPSRDTDGGPPFSGRAGRRLAKACGVEDLGDVFDMVNLIDRFPGKAGKGDRFPAKLARERAAALELGDHELVVFGGRAVAQAFDVHRNPFLKWFRFGGRSAAIIPHPSGIVTWWNSPENQRRARRFLRRHVRQCAAS